MLTSGRIKRPDGEELFEHLVSHSCPSRLEVGDEHLQDLDAPCLHLSRQHLALPVPFCNFLQLAVVFQEELEVLKGNVDIEPGAEGTVFFDGVAATGEGILVDLCGNFGGGVGHKDGGDLLRGGAHLGMVAEKRGEEDAA